MLAAALRLALLVCAWNAPVADAWPAALEHAAPPTGVVTPDSKGYVALAVDLHRGQFGSAAREIFRTPGYPAFLLVSFVAGEHWWQAVLLLQIAIDVLLVYLTYRLALALFGRNAVLAAIFQATSAIATASSMRILSDGLFAMLLTLAILLFVRFWLRGGRAWLAVSAVVLSAACYVRPVGQVFAAVLATAMIVRVARLFPFASPRQRAKRAGRASFGRRCATAGQGHRRRGNVHRPRRGAAGPLGIAERRHGGLRRLFQLRLRQRLRRRRADAPERAGGKGKGRPDRRRLRAAIHAGRGSGRRRQTRPSDARRRRPLPPQTIPPA